MGGGWLALSTQSRTAVLGSPGIGQVSLQGTSSENIGVLGPLVGVGEGQSQPQEGPEKGTLEPCLDKTSHSPLVSATSSLTGHLNSSVGRGAER